MMQFVLFLLLSGKFKKNMIEYTLFSSSEAEKCNAKNDIVINCVGIYKTGTKSKQYFLFTPSEVGKNVWDEKIHIIGH